MKTFLLLCCSLLLGVSAQAALPFGSQFDKGYWGTLDDRGKQAFLAGLCVGLGFNGFDRSPPPSGEHLTLLPEEIPKLIPLIDTYYQTHFGLVRSAAGIGLMQLNHRPQAEIDEAIGEAEKAWK